MSMCLGKQWYDTLEIAQRVADIYTQTHRNNHKLRPYDEPCPICGRWHITSKPPRGQRK